MSFVILFLLLAAPFVGSFLALLADRLAAGREAIFAPSACDHCQARLGLRDLVPVLSWLLLRGKSRCCGKPLRSSLPAVELAALGLAIWAVLITEGAIAAASIGLGWSLLGLSLIDLRIFRLPDLGTLPLVLAGLGLALAGLTGPVLKHALGALIGYGALAGIGWLYLKLRGREGLGLGDAKLLAAAGAWLGVLALPSVLLWACFAGLVQAIGMGLGQGNLSGKLAIPFGPALACGFWLTWLYGPVALG